jgi:oligopeptidase A
MPDSSSTENPLLHITRNIPFDQIRPEHVEPGIEALLKEARAALALIAKQEDKPRFENTLLALEAATEKLEIASTLVGHLESVATTTVLRERTTRWTRSSVSSIPRFL